MADGRIQKLVNAAKAAARKNLLAGYTRQTLLEKMKQLDLALGARRKVGGSSFGRRRVIPAAIPEKHGLAKSGAGGDEGFAAIGLRGDFVQGEKIAGRQFID